MRDVYIVEAVRSPIGRRRGDLATLHPGDLLGAVQKGALPKCPYSSDSIPLSSRVGMQILILLSSLDHQRR